MKSAARDVFFHLVKAIYYKAIDCEIGLKVRSYLAIIHSLTIRNVINDSGRYHYLPLPILAQDRS